MMDAQTLYTYETSAAARCEHYRLILPTELLQFATTRGLPRWEP